MSHFVTYKLKEVVFMVVELYKEEDVEADLENLVNFLNQISNNIKFKLGNEKFVIKNKKLSFSKIESNYLSKEIKNDDFSFRLKSSK